jgi:hypothetical protein
MWLGQADPATGLLAQARNDPELEALGALLKAWYAVFGSTPTTVRNALAKGTHRPDLLDAIRDLPVEEHGEINPGKLGWVLKRNANRIVEGLEFRTGRADGRTAWQAVVASPPFSEASPVSAHCAADDARIDEMTG